MWTEILLSVYFYIHYSSVQTVFGRHTVEHVCTLLRVLKSTSQVSMWTLSLPGCCLTPLQSNQWMVTNACKRQGSWRLHTVDQKRKPHLPLPRHTPMVLLNRPKAGKMWDMWHIVGLAWVCAVLASLNVQPTVFLELDFRDKLKIILRKQALTAATALTEAALL